MKNIIIIINYLIIIGI